MQTVVLKRRADSKTAFAYLNGTRSAMRDNVWLEHVRTYVISRCALAAKSDCDNETDEVTCARQRVA
eukprot:11188691-Lingulodinium_polyedra.AAC.1